jgi:hypothetical protein
MLGPTVNWDNEDFVRAVRSTGRKTLIILAYLAALLVNRAVCMSCVPDTALIPSADERSQALDRIGRVLVVRREHERSGIWGRTTTVVSVNRPESTRRSHM